ncbi:hypothetical protein [Litoribacillus peritrichatus]|uniref:Uncharacterized protein n=1 Tax=Litoribacillus peritrichatus TaxID=718191 RepID=A0ABP7N2L1_9GAMM
MNDKTELIVETSENATDSILYPEIGKTPRKDPFHTLNKITTLRQLHIQSIAQIWSESDEITKFIEEAGEDYKSINPTEWVCPESGEKPYQESFWARLTVKLGPVKVFDKLSNENPYRFWYKGVAPIFNSSNGGYMVQPFVNNRIIIKLPKKPENLSPTELTKAIAAYFVSSPGLFGDSHISQHDLNFKNSGASVLGDLNILQEQFQLNSGLFIKMVTRFTSEYNFDPVEQTIDSVIVPQVDVHSTYDLSDSPSVYNSFGAAMQNLLALMWSSEEIRKAVITKPEDIEKHPPGQTVRIIKELIGYEYPFLLDLIIEEDNDTAFFDKVNLVDRDSGVVSVKEAQGGLELRNRWVWRYDQETIDQLDSKGNLSPSDYYIFPKIPLQTLEMVVPIQPQLKDNSPVALSRYNVDSAGFPFSC